MVFVPCTPTVDIEMAEFYAGSQAKLVKSDAVGTNCIFEFSRAGLQSDSPHRMLDHDGHPRRRDGVLWAGGAENGVTVMGHVQRKLQPLLVCFWHFASW